MKISYDKKKSSEHTKKNTTFARVYVRQVCLNQNLYDVSCQHGVVL